MFTIKLHVIQINFTIDNLFFIKVGMMSFIIHLKIYDLNSLKCLALGGHSALSFIISLCTQGYRNIKGHLKSP